MHVAYFIKAWGTRLLRFNKVSLPSSMMPQSLNDIRSSQATITTEPTEVMLIHPLFLVKYSNI